MEHGKKIALEDISDGELIERLKVLVKRETGLLHRVVLHLAEVERRRLHAVQGYGSLFDYAKRYFGYSDASAQRRVKAAKVLVRFPDVYPLLKDGRVTLDTLGLVADALGSEHASALLREIIGKSRAEAVRIAAFYFPVDRAKLADRIEPIVVRQSKSAQESSMSLFDYSAEGMGQDNCGEVIPEKFTSLRSESSNLVENEYRISFVAGAALAAKLERAKELVGNGAPVDLEEVFEQALDAYLERKDPARRVERRKKRLESKNKREASQAVDHIEELQKLGVALEEQGVETKRGPRFVSGKLRDEILSRDGYCCTYVAPDGTRCACKTALEIDHKIPWSYGGATEAGNLQTVCRAHNQMLARQVFGDAEIDAILARRKPDRLGIPQVFRKPSPLSEPAEWMLYGEPEGPGFD